MRFLYLFYLVFSSVDATALPQPYKTAQYYTVSSYQEFTYKIIRAASNTYGYEIYHGKKLLIKQTTIPGIAGNKGFQIKSDAEKVANLVISKLSKGIMPPAIDKTEMDHLKIKYQKV